jgi:hypothetical protein
MAYSADDIRRLLGENEAAIRRCRMQAEKINGCASDQLDRVNARLAQMQPGQVATDPVLAYEYQQLISERGRLSLL